jgi:hypothetical protein
MNSWIQSHSNGKIDVLDPDWRQIKLEDVAQGLATQNRFNGQVREPYNVADHCVRGTMFLQHKLQTPENANLPLVFLLHELGEVFLPEVTSPLKQFISVEVPWAPFPVPWKELERRHTTAILRALGLSIPQSDFDRPEIRQMDLAMLAWEARELHGPPPDDWHLPEVPPTGDVLTPLHWRSAKALWLSLYRQLTGTP